MNELLKNGSNFLESILKNFKDIINGPPFLAIFFVSTFLLFFTFKYPDHFYIFLAIFLFSIFGLIWRHAIKDLTGKLNKVVDKKEDVDKDKFSKHDLWISSAYHIINFVLTGGLIFIIVHYCI